MQMLADVRGKPRNHERNQCPLLSLGLPSFMSYFTVLSVAMYSVDIGNDLKGLSRNLIDVPSRIFLLEGLKKSKENLTQDTQCLQRDSS
jgi:hypothetical protein